jgi:hypothetical protein
VSHVYEEVKRRTELLEKLELAIPGYRGYKEKELRREADRLIRQHLLDRLRPAHRNLKSVMPAIAASGDPNLAQLYNQVQAVFDRVIAKLRAASYGYSGFFDAVKIREAELDRMLEFDWGLVEAVDRIARAVDSVVKSEPGKLAEALAALRGELLSFEDLLAKREEVVRGIPA